MTNYTKVIELANLLLQQADSYSTRPTKAESKRLRSTMNDIKKLVTPAKQDLIEADKS